MIDINKKKAKIKAKKPPRVLIVEDEIIIALDLKFTLEQLGCKIIKIVTSGEESIEAVRLHLPDVVLMDIKLKGAMNGIEAAEIIYHRWQIPVIYISAYSDLSLLKRMNKTKKFRYLNKPVALYELKDSLENALNREIEFN